MKTSASGLGFYWFIDGRESVGGNGSEQTKVFFSPEVYAVSQPCAFSRLIFAFHCWLVPLSLELHIIIVLLGTDGCREWDVR